MLKDGFIAVYCKQTSKYADRDFGGMLQAPRRGGSGHVLHFKDILWKALVRAQENTCWSENPKKSSFVTGEFVSQTRMKTVA